MTDLRVGQRVRTAHLPGTGSITKIFTVTDGETIIEIDHRIWVGIAQIEEVWPVNHSVRPPDPHLVNILGWLCMAAVLAICLLQVNYR